MTGLRPSSTLEFAGTTVTTVRAQCCRNPATNSSPFPPSVENLWSEDGYFHIHQVKNCAFACRRHCATIWQAKTATSQAKKNLLTCSKHAARRIAKVGFVSVKSVSNKLWACLPVHIQPEERHPSEQSVPPRRLCPVSYSKTS